MNWAYTCTCAIAWKYTHTNIHRKIRRLNRVSNVCVQLIERVNEKEWMYERIRTLFQRKPIQMGLQIHWHDINTTTAACCCRWSVCVCVKTHKLRCADNLAIRVYAQCRRFSTHCTHHPAFIYSIFFVFIFFLFFFSFWYCMLK